MSPCVCRTVHGKCVAELFHTLGQSYKLSFHIFVVVPAFMLHSYLNITVYRRTGLKLQGVRLSLNKLQVFVIHLCAVGSLPCARQVYRKFPIFYSSRSSSIKILAPPLGIHIKGSIIQRTAWWVHWRTTLYLPDHNIVKRNRMWRTVSLRISAQRFADQIIQLQRIAVRHRKLCSIRCPIGSNIKLSLSGSCRSIGVF
ncbi:hypothetical protein D3C71_1342730 [compost metagenome]